uniref:Trimeric autotransporter adhesin YadA-like head domain-containing protein n=1 Tax=Marseillevirus LCMAC101 TaxID=2506602 RepID=A0A481YS77_9VIRU|nr:MAG: hypothetical protein LCMAC101_04050 [Marseillevirus LCMAC101]
MTLPNTSVRRDLTFDNLKVSSSIIIPRIFIATTPAIPDGKIAFDLATKKFYFASDRVWVEAGLSGLIIAGEANEDIQVVEAPADTYTISVGKKENALGTENLIINGSITTGSTATGTTAYGFRAASVSSQSNFATAVGYRAGETSQGTNSVAIGVEAGEETQGNDGVAVGSGSGKNNQGNNTVAIGKQAGEETQGNDCVAIGSSAGKLTQGSSAVAIGLLAGAEDQADSAVAIGTLAGNGCQGSSAVAIGHAAGEDNQGDFAIAIGREAGEENQGEFAIAIGREAGEGSIFLGVSQGDRSIAIGYRAGTPGGAAVDIPVEAILLGFDCAAPADGRLSLKQPVAVTAGATAGAGVLPATPEAFWPVMINGTVYKIPLYNT